MKDDRLCKCGMGESFVTHGPCPMGHPRGQCHEGMHNYHDFEEATPSTDEGEARWTRGEESPDIVVWRAVGREVLPYVEMPKSLEAAIRAPLEERIRAADQRALFWENATAASVVTLEQERVERRAAEERIRELEAARDRVRDALPEMLEMAGGGEFLTGLWAQRLLDSHNRTKDAEAEVERLREALRGARESAESVEVWLRPLLCDDDVTICSHPICNAWIAAGLTASNLRALATPPSSTEGPKEVEG